MQCQHCGYPIPVEASVCPRCSHPFFGSAGAGQADSALLSPYAPTQRAAGGSPSLVPPQMAGAVNPVSLTPPPPPGWTLHPSSAQVGAGWAPAPPRPVPVFVAVQPRPKSGCSTAAIVVLAVLLVLVCAGALVGGGIWYTQSRNALATMTAISGSSDATASAIDDAATATAVTMQLTPTPYPSYTESNPPSGVDFSGTAQHIVTYAQMASQLNSHYQPTELQSHFRVAQRVYLAYHWINTAYAGYVDMIWYFNGSPVGHLRSDFISTRYSYYDGYSAYTFTGPGQGAVEVYWCATSGCSDRQLAWVRPFSVIG